MAKSNHFPKIVSSRTKVKIKQLWLTGNFTLKELSLEYKVSESTVSEIITKMFKEKEAITITLQSKIK